ncbi:MAG TPA: hypothetical protein PKM16_06555 [Bacteroidia bacterium]|nr:hypothetical protein [Bacteroidia bacterium]
MKYKNSLNSILILLSIFALTLSSCQTFKEDNERLNRQIDSILVVSMQKDSAIDGYLGTLTEIADNLDSITVKQDVITLSSGNNPEFNKDSKQRINDAILTINEIMEKSKERLSNLESQLRNSRYKTKNLEKLIDDLRIQIMAKDSELVVLNNKLADLNLHVAQLSTSIDSLKVENQNRDQTITDKTNIIHTVYYVVGTYKELRDKKVLSKEGGFLGIGKEETLLKNFDSSQFTKVDSREFNSLTINNKSAKVLTAHPTDSYSLNKNAKGVVKSITITNFKKF